MSKSECQCEQSKRKHALIASKERRTLRNPRPTKLFIAWLVGWLLFAVVFHRVLTTELEEQKVLFDPFEILGISSAAEPEEIKKVYKKLSLKWHPDKADDKELAEVEFVKISKAYRALTDDETRKNWELYGDPDGKQSLTYGIALPTWIVDPSNKFVVLGFYGTVFGFLMPWLLARWWNSSKKFSREGVLNHTMGIYFQDLKENFNSKKILELICSSVEFQECVPWRGQRDFDAVMDLFKKVRDVVYEKTGERLELPKKYNQAYCYKAFVIAHAHIFRVNIEDSLLLEDSYSILPKFTFLATKGVMSLTSAHYWLQESLNCLETSRMIIQAVPFAWTHTESSELHQLPHFDAEKIKLVRNKRKSVKTIAGLMDLSLEERKAYLAEVGLNQNQIHDIIAAGRKIPRLLIESAKFECTGESLITPDSLVTFVLKLKAVNLEGEETPGFVPPKTERKNSSTPKSPKPSDSKSKEGSKESVSEEPDESKSPETEVDTTSRLTKLLNGSLFENTNDPAYCPYYPEIKRPMYYMYLCNPRNNRVIGNPIPINSLENNKSKTVKFSFQSPSQAGTFAFTCIVQCDSYSVSASQDIRMVVEEPRVEIESKRAQEDKSAWQDLEEEEQLEKEGYMGAQSMAMAMQGRLSKEANEDDATDWESSDSDDDDE